MSNPNCILVPEVNGKESKLYKDLLKTKGLPRPIVNYIYAAYVSSLKAQMDQNVSLVKDLKGQHLAGDVLKYINWNGMADNIKNIHLDEVSLGAVDVTSQRIDFADAWDALKKADDFNNTHSGSVAYVIQRGDKYQIFVIEKNSRTLDYGISVGKKLKTWEICKQAFAAKGVDIDALPAELKETFSAYQTDIVQQLANLKNTPIDYMYKRGTMLLFHLDPNSTHVQRLVNNFGSIEAAAQAINDYNQGTATLTTPQRRLLLNAVNHCKQFQGIDLQALANQISQETDAYVASHPEETIRQTIDKLNKKYHININEIHREGQTIKHLSEVAADAAILLERRIRELKKQMGNNAEGKRLEAILNKMMKELANKKYCSSILDLLAEAAVQVAEIDNYLANIPQTGTKLERGFANAEALYKINVIREQYEVLVSALANDGLSFDESISQTDINNIRAEATRLKQIFENKRIQLDNMAELAMVDIISGIMGDKAPDGQAMFNIIKMASAEVSKMDFFYSMGRSSNPIIAAMGTIIRDAQDGRDKIMNDIARRIRRATNKLYTKGKKGAINQVYKRGSNTEFMYEDDGHIISDIDWGKYNAAKEAVIKSLVKQGIRGFDLKEAIENWEENNTEERAVDVRNGNVERTERVPNQNYRNNKAVWDDVNHKLVFNPGILTPEQQEYYDTMMQIKGEIGSLLPDYAQNHYLPPQLRRNMFDAFGDGDIITGVKNKLVDTYKIREDDTNYNTNGIISGEKYVETKGDFSNGLLKQIPIFYVNEVEQGELLKDFSGGLQALAGTAINYDAMNKIQEVIEFMGDWTSNQSPRAKKGDTTAKDAVSDGYVKVIKDLFSKNKDTAEMIRSFIDYHLYGVRRAPNENKKRYKVWDKIIGYTSFKGLATNFKGAVANGLVGEFQMMIEAGCGEFYNWADFLWAHTRLFGRAGFLGEAADLFTSNINSKGMLMKELFDPLQENFDEKSRERYHKSMFRQFISHDCSFIGYSTGEDIIHYVNMYACLHHIKVKQNGKVIPLYDAFEVKKGDDSNSELHLKAGVTDINGNAITEEFIQDVRRKVRYCNQTTHGSMNTEDKGLIHQRWWGRGIMNFRQWMVEHYSRRFRGRHFDFSLKEEREGYWVSFWKALHDGKVAEYWEDKERLKAVGQFGIESLKFLYNFMVDWCKFTHRAAAEWNHLDEMQRRNIRRVQAELRTYVALLIISMGLGEPDEHKREFWRRFAIYQVKRMMLDTEASMPIPEALHSALTILNSPMAGVQTLNSFMYLFYGLYNGDLHERLKSGPHKGEIKYWRNFKKYVLPFYKDWEQINNLSKDDAIYQIFKKTPNKL